MTEEITPQRAVNLFLSELSNGQASFEQAPLVLSEDQILTLKIALIDGWTNLELFSEATLRFCFIGVNERVKSLYGVYIPDYTRRLDAIASVYHRLNISYSLKRDAESGVVEVSAMEQSLTGEDEAIALCQLLTRLKIELAKPLVECERCKAVPSEFKSEASSGAKKLSGVIEVEFG